MKHIIKKGRHSTYLLQAHLIFVTKFRKKVFTNEYLNYIEDIFRDTLIENECNLIEFNGESDHVHLLIEFNPKVSISKLVNNLKGRSSRLLRRDRPEVKKILWGKAKLWSPSYFAGSVGSITLEVLEKYIKDQDRPK